MKPLSVCPYSIHNLKELFAGISASNLDIINGKNQVKYFQEYFAELKAKTILVEYNYIDRDYLEDYTAYYARCFHPYRRKCNRLHFFKLEFTEAQFELLLLDNNNIELKAFKESYLGFIIVKPLPKTIIGRTCLSSYQNVNGRSYPILREYKANLFGISLEVQSLAFQEQDHVTAACATSALWSTFHGTGTYFHHYIPSPSEITKGATDKYPSIDRVLPNNGLIIEQMAQAIKNVGLETYPKNVKNDFILLTTVYAYLKSKIPIILVFDLIANLHKSKLARIRKGKFQGKHAVAITGFRLNGPKEILIGENRFKTRAYGISKLYVHDDQVGPFARMNVDGEIIKVDYGLNQKVSYSLSASWQDENGKYGSIRAIPDIVLIPLYKKIRIPFSDVQDTIIHYNTIIDTPIKKGFLDSQDSLEWEIYLISVEDLKTEIFESNLSNVEKARILRFEMPKYIWRSTAFWNDSKVFDLLFDATDIKQGPFFLTAIEYNLEMGKFFREFFSVEVVGNKVKGSSEWKIIDWYRKN